MFCVRLHWLSLVLALLAAGPVAAISADLPAALLADARDGRLDDFDLPSAALLAGGASDPAELAQCQKQLARRLAQCDAPSLALLPAGPRAAALVQRLHECVLTGRYDRQASELRIVLDRGDYNCLSALVLFAELCRQAELEIEIWSLPGHVFGRLPGDPDSRIEPTCREPSRPIAELNAAHPPRPITQVELLGRFYYNRGVTALAAGDFAQGVELLRIACRLDPRDPDARANLLAGLNNWALALLADDQAAPAARLIDIGLALDPHFAPLRANAEYVRQRIPPAKRP